MRRALNPLSAKRPPRAAKAKHLIHFFNGGLPQVDTSILPMLAKWGADPAQLKTERQTAAAFALQVQSTAEAASKSATFSRVGEYRRHLRDPLMVAERLTMNLACR